MALESDLQVAQSLYLIHMRDEFGIMMGVQQVVLKHREFTRLRNGVIITIFSG